MGWGKGRVLKMVDWSGLPINRLTVVCYAVGYYTVIIFSKFFKFKLLFVWFKFFFCIMEFKDSLPAWMITMSSGKLLDS